jgi:hypothetical protein
MSPRILGYLMGTAFIGGHVGLAHGLATGIRNVRGLEGILTDKEVHDGLVKPIIENTFSGVFLGPWAPLIIPYWILRGDRPACPLIASVTDTVDRLK